MKGIAVVKAGISFSIGIGNRLGLSLLTSIDVRVSIVAIDVGSMKSIAISIVKTSISFSIGISSSFGFPLLTAIDVRVTIVSIVVRSMKSIAITVVKTSISISFRLGLRLSIGNSCQSNKNQRLHPGVE